MSKTNIRGIQNRQQLSDMVSTTCDKYMRTAWKHKI